MKFGESVATCLKECANFSGRAMRSEYWWAMLAQFCVNILLSFSLSILGASEELIASVSLLVWAALFLSTLAMNVRRLHDVGRSGWWYLLIFTGFGALLWIYWMLKPSAKGANKYGEQP